MPPKSSADDKKDHGQQPQSTVKSSGGSAGEPALASPILSDDAKMMDAKEIAELKQICSPLRSVNAGEKNDDLAAMKAIIGNATVVALGEGTHGTAEFSKMKHRLLEYLVVEMGFTIFAMEANMAECQRINEYVLGGNGNLRNPFKETNWVWNTQEIFDMIEWMRRYNLTAKTKLQFTGFDMQSPDPATEIIARNLLRADFKSDSIDPHKVMDEIKKAIAVVCDPLIKKPKQNTSEAYSTLMKNIALLQMEIEKQQKYLEGKLGAEDYQCTVQNIKLLKQYVESSKLSFAECWVYRDKAMADNLLGIMQKNPDAKIVVWGHNLHIYTQRPVQMTGDSFKPMGEHLAGTLGDNYRAIGFLAYAGTYTALTKASGMLRRDWVLSVPPENALESILKKVGYPITLLNLHVTNAVNAVVPKAIQGPKDYEDSLLLRTVGATGESEGSFGGQLRASYDGIIYIENTTASQPISTHVHNARLEWFFFKPHSLKKAEDMPEVHKHELQHEYDKRFGLVLYRPQ